MRVIRNKTTTLDNLIKKEIQVSDVRCVVFMIPLVVVVERIWGA